MPKYRVWFVQTASTCVEIEAESAEDAADQAEPNTGGLCHHCSRDIELSGDWVLAEDDAVEEIP